MTRADQEEVSDDMLMALADGELPAPQAQALRRKIAANPALTARYAAFVETRALMQEAFVADPVPDRLIAAVLQTPMAEPNVVPLRRPLRAATGWAMAIAASLVLAVGGFWTGRSTAPLGAEGTNIGALTASLATGAELGLPDGTTARVLGSFDTDLGLCRIVAQDNLRHVACRAAQTGAWTVALSVENGGADSFLPASDMATGLIDGLLTDLGAGPALTPDEERRRLAQ